MEPSENENTRTLFYGVPFLRDILAMSPGLFFSKNRARGFKTGWQRLTGGVGWNQRRMGAVCIRHCHPGGPESQELLQNRP